MIKHELKSNLFCDKVPLYFFCKCGYTNLNRSKNLDRIIGQVKIWLASCVPVFSGKSWSFVTYLLTVGLTSGFCLWDSDLWVLISGYLTSFDRSNRFIGIFTETNNDITCNMPFFWSKTKASEKYCSPGKAFQIFPLSSK